MADKHLNFEDTQLTVGKNTYFIDTTDRSINSAEFTRLNKQDDMMNAQMMESSVGLLPEGYVPTEESAMLDVACGPGGWIREVSRDYPGVMLVGIDNNRKVIAYAQNHRQTGSNPNVTFELGNVHDPIDYDDGTFDFVNIRFISGVLSTNEQEWIRLIQECFRLLKPGGYLRITEAEMSWIAHAPVNNRFTAAIMRVMWTAGKTFAEHQLALTPVLGGFFESGGFEEIRQQLLPINYSYGAPAHQAVMEDTLMAMRVTRNALISIGGIPAEEFDALFAEMEREMDSEQYRAVWPIVVIEGRKPL